LSESAIINLPESTEGTSQQSMPRESKKNRLTRIYNISDRMAVLYPEAACGLIWHDPFSLLIAVILSAQTTDQAVNRVTPELFRHWPDAASLAVADPDQLMSVVRRLGLFRVKTRNCRAVAEMIMLEFSGEVPQSMQQLLRLPGVGRKTANIVLTEAFQVVEGIAVDTHVFRIAHRLGLVDKAADTPEKTERELLRVIPDKLWGQINHRWVLFGREFCTARNSHCEICPLAELCPSAVK
jgi:endonuclease-3